jgi:class 3 adenylate cyclase
MSGKKIFEKIVVIVAVLLIVGLSSFLPILSSVNNIFTNSLFTLDEVSDEIVLIVVDDKSTLAPPYGLGKFSNWSRKHFSRVLGNLEGAKVIGIDFLFNSPSEMVNFDEIEKLEYDLSNTDSKDEVVNTFIKELIYEVPNLVDQNFAQSIEDAGNVVLAELYSEEEGNFIKPMYEFAKGADLAYVNTIRNEDGVASAIVPAVEDEEHFALKIAKNYLEKEGLEIPSDPMLINYFADPGSFKRISFSDVYHGEFDKEDIKDKIVLIGITSSKEIHDEHLTPRSNSEMMTGVEINANTIQTILDGKFIVEQSSIAKILTVAIITAILCLVFASTNILLSTLLALLTLTAYYIAARIAYQNGTILNMIYPFMAIILSYIAAWVYRYFIANKGKREMKNAFGHYVSKELVDQISKNPEMVKLGGEKRVITVFFSDIKGSTTYSEELEISAWVSQINEYFTVMERVVYQFGGTLDKYEGDAIMGFWNAPVPQEDHVIRAYITALSMKKALADLHKKWGNEGKPLIEFRIGINTGEAIVGNFGSANRFDYTAMGDTVNTASRLESSANKTYGTKMIVAGYEGVIKLEHLEQFLMRELDTVLLLGKNEPVKLFELIAMKKEASSEEKGRTETYAKGLAEYRAKNFEQAIEAFQSMPNDAPSKVMLARCKTLQEGGEIAELHDGMLYEILNK